MANTIHRLISSFFSTSLSSRKLSQAKKLSSKLMAGFHSVSDLKPFKTMWRTICKLTEAVTVLKYLNYMERIIM